MKYQGSCQCQAVRFTIESDITESMTCNCSMCGKKGFALTFVPPSQFVLESGEDNLTEYRFNKKQIAHLFCKTCGVEAFARGKNPDGSETVMVNLRCLEGIDLSTLKTSEFNGKDY